MMINLLFHFHLDQALGQPTDIHLTLSVPETS